MLINAIILPQINLMESQSNVIFSNQSLCKFINLLFYYFVEVKMIK